MVRIDVQSLPIVIWQNSSIRSQNFTKRTIRMHATVLDNHRFHQIKILIPYSFTWTTICNCWSTTYTAKVCPLPGYINDMFILKLSVTKRITRSSVSKDEWMLQTRLTMRRKALPRIVVQLYIMVYLLGSCSVLMRVGSFVLSQGPFL
jgi:hypothetical protein